MISEATRCWWHGPWLHAGHHLFDRDGHYVTEASVPVGRLADGFDTGYGTMFVGIEVVLNGPGACRARCQRCGWICHGSFTTSSFAYATTTRLRCQALRGRSRSAFNDDCRKAVINAAARHSCASAP